MRHKMQAVPATHRQVGIVPVSESFPVFLFVLVLQHTQVRGVPAFADEVFFHSTSHGTSRLVCVGAVVETAVGGKTHHLWEVATEFTPINIDKTKTLNARGVDDITALDGVHG